MVSNEESGFSKYFSELKKFAIPLPYTSLLTGLIMALILSLAVMIRLLPLRWGFYLSEFDPYFHYRIAEHIVKYGFSSLATWHDTMGWYPYGRDIASVSFPGLAMTAASLYFILNAIGISLTLFELCVIFPVIMAALTCIAIYFLGKYLGGKEAGLLAAFFLALNSSYISRTSLGFFDDETIGILGIIVLCFFFLKSIDERQDTKSTLIYAFGAGIFLGYVSASWGAVRYPIDMLALYVLALLVLRRYSRKLLLSYTVTYAVAFFIAINVPKLGLDFLMESFNLPVYAILSLMLFIELYRKLQNFKNAPIILFAIIALISLAFISVLFYGLVKLPAGKFISVVNPFERSKIPLLESVAEHKPSAWGSFYVDLGFSVFLITIGAYFAARELTNKNIFLLVYGITALYFSSSMIRLMLIAAPAFSLLSAFGVTNLLKPFFKNLREIQGAAARRRFRIVRVGKEYSLTAIMIIFLLLTVNYAIPEPRIYRSAYSPTTIASASLPVRSSSTVPDWIATLGWMRDNLPKGSVVVSWWDYGYWITTLGNQTTIVDNATWNTTQIQNVGRMFMSPEEEAIKILKMYNATHVVVFTTFDNYGRDIGWGDEGKWFWMARIAGLNESDFGEYTQGGWAWNDLGKNTTIYKLMNYARGTKLGMAGNPPQFFKLVYTSPGTVFPLGRRNCYVLVCVYEVNYPTQ